MRSDEKNALWRQLTAAREEFEESAVVPIRRSRVDGRPKEPSRKAVRLAEALAVSDSWSRIKKARNKRLAA